MSQIHSNELIRIAWFLNAWVRIWSQFLVWHSFEQFLIVWTIFKKPLTVSVKSFLGRLLMMVPLKKKDEKKTHVAERLHTSSICDIWKLFPFGCKWWNPVKLYKKKAHTQAKERKTFKFTKLKKKTPGWLAKSITLKKIAKEKKRKGRSRPTSIELIT